MVGERPRQENVSQVGSMRLNVSNALKDRSECVTETRQTAKCLRDSPLYLKVSLHSDNPGATIKQTNRKQSLLTAL